jgi:hypothetical protein
MPHLPDHRNHDPLLIAALAAGDAEGADLEQARALVAACDDCAELHHDLRAISVALPAMPAPARPRDFRLTPEQAASLRPAGWRRLLAPLAGPRFAFAAPLGGSLAALGIAGILIAGAASTPVANVSAPDRERSAAAPATQDATKIELDHAVPDASAAPGALPAPVPQPSVTTPEYGVGSASAAGDPAPSEVPADVVLASPAASGDGLVGRLSDGSTAGGDVPHVATGAPAANQPAAAEAGPTPGAPSGDPAPFAGLAVLLLVLGSLLVAGRWLAMRVA